MSCLAWPGSACGRSSGTLKSDAETWSEPAGPPPSVCNQTNHKNDPRSFIKVSTNFDDTDYNVPEEGMMFDSDLPQAFSHSVAGKFKHDIARNLFKLQPPQTMIQPHPETSIVLSSYTMLNVIHTSPGLSLIIKLLRL